MTNPPNLFGNRLLSLADARMTYSEQRTAVLAQDVANADTPGYVARDLPDFATLLQDAGLQDMGLQTTRLAPPSGGSTIAPADPPPASQDVPGPMTPDGNAVDVEQTLARLADTDSAQRLAAELYTKYLGFFRTAAGQ
jgi:flagellar basal-body rod protein FlgB